MLRRSFASLCPVPSGWLGATRPLLIASNRRRHKHLVRFTFQDEHNPLSEPVKLDPGVLYVVPVPIGNLKDFSLRALETLRQADYIVCVNRVATQLLMDIVDINSAGRLVQHNKHIRQSHRLVELLRGGASAALVCPQGQPVVGDAGGDIVANFLSQGVRVSALPGPCAAVTALAMSGSPGSEDAFHFGGHLSLERGVRMRQLAEAAASRMPSVFYEAMPRLRTSLEELCALCPGRKATVVHEISKLHEATHRDTVERLRVFYTRRVNRASQGGGGKGGERPGEGQVTIVVDADPARLARAKRILTASGREQKLLEKRRQVAPPERTADVDPVAEGKGASLVLPTTTTSGDATSSSSSPSGLTFRERAIANLVREQVAAKQRLRLPVSQAASASGASLVQEAVVFVADAMGYSRAEVMNSYRKALSVMTASEVGQDDADDAVSAAPAAAPGAASTDGEAGAFYHTAGWYKGMGPETSAGKSPWAAIKLPPIQEVLDRQQKQLQGGVTDLQGQHLPDDWTPIEDSGDSAVAPVESEGDVLSRIGAEGKEEGGAAAEQQATTSDAASPPRKGAGAGAAARRKLAFRKALAVQRMRTQIARVRLAQEMRE